MDDLKRLSDDEHLLKAALFLYRAMSSAERLAVMSELNKIDSTL
ncbi:hypothetical protein [Brenneria alni]|nr:hypothetical protein [Brenneria alni]